jgi:hypothetical protein
VSRLKSDLTGKTLGRWTVLKKESPDLYLCQCACGNKRRVYRQNLRKGTSKSCGCLRKESPTWNYRDLTGQKFNNLTVLGLHHNTEGRTFWRCRCACGNETIVALGNLPRTLSCGCQKYRRLPEAARNLVFRNYAKAAEDRNLEWGITGGLFDVITQTPCHYCGLPPSTVATMGQWGHSVYTYNGIDRMDNNRGYTEDNVVPCCTACNRAKGTMPYRQFVEYIRRLVGHFPVLDRQ